MAQVIWAGPAMTDLEAIAEFIALDKPDAAGAFVAKVFAHVEKLQQNPLLGPRIPELLPKSRYRQLVQAPCRVFYRYDRKADICWILHVMRGEKLFHRQLLLHRDPLL